MAANIGQGSSSGSDQTYSRNMGQDFVLRPASAETSHPETGNRTLKITDTDKKITVIVNLGFDIKSFPQIAHVTNLVNNRFNIKGTAVISPKLKKSIEKIERLRLPNIPAKSKAGPQPARAPAIPTRSNSLLLRLSPRVILSPLGPTTPEDREQELNLKASEERRFEDLKPIKDWFKELLVKSGKPDASDADIPKKDIHDGLTNIFTSDFKCRDACIKELRTNQELEKKVGRNISTLSNSELAVLLFKYNKDLFLDIIYGKPAIPAEALDLSASAVAEAPDVSASAVADIEREEAIFKLIEKIADQDDVLADASQHSSDEIIVSESTDSPLSDINSEDGIKTLEKVEDQENQDSVIGTDDF